MSKQLFLNNDLHVSTSSMFIGWVNIHWTGSGKVYKVNYWNHNFWLLSLSDVKICPQIEVWLCRVMLGDTFNPYRCLHLNHSNDIKHLNWNGTGNYCSLFSNIFSVIISNMVKLICVSIMSNFENYFTFRSSAMQNIVDNHVRVIMFACKNCAHIGVWSLNNLLI